MAVYSDAVEALAKDIFHGQDYALAWNLPSSDAVTVEIWDGDPSTGDLRDSVRVSIPWLMSVQPDPNDIRVDNPEVITLGQAPSGGWSITHIRVQSGDVGSEVPLWESTVSGGTLAVDAAYYVEIPANLLLSILTWPQGDSGTGAPTHIHPAEVILEHALGGINEIRTDTTFTVELWDHDPLHISHGTPLTSWTVARDSTEWTITPGSPLEVENANALTSVAAAPVGGWDVAYTTIRVTGGTAFLFKSSTPLSGVVAEGDNAEIAAGAILFTLEAA